jgi:hypothetical protein
MGRAHSLDDKYPSVTINGYRYRYGRDPEYGYYLVENASLYSAKGLWPDPARGYWGLGVGFPEELMRLHAATKEDFSKGLSLLPKPHWSRRG